MDVRSPTGDGGDHPRAEVEHPDQVVVGVGEVEVPAVVEGDPLRLAEQGLVGRAVGVAPHASHARDRGDGAARHVDLAQDQVLGVAQVQGAVREREPAREAERRIAPDPVARAREAELAGEGRHAVPFVVSMARIRFASAT